MMYKSPIEMIVDQMEFCYNNEVMRAVQNYGITVDKNELIRALRYDREQYEKGYREGYVAGQNNVVHCCDCMYSKTIYENGAVTWHCKKAYGMPEVDPTDYCSHGERREEDD